MSPESASGHKEPGHQRRPRYKGTHPKRFEDKYKELQPEQYADDVAKVIARGATPAGMHRSICVTEILDILQIKPGETGLDATLGYGGHTLEMLKCLDSKGRIVAIDVDPIEMPRTKARLERLGFGPEILEIRQMNFSEIDELVSDCEKFDFVLADFGVSSMQIDNPDRGFSFKRDGPLDLRLNPSVGETAASRLKTISMYELEGILTEYADEPNASVIAHAIVANRKKGTLATTTAGLQKMITAALKPMPKMNADAIKKSCQRCFQALRIDVNNEFGVIDAFLEKLPTVLAPGGRVAILTFHSGEDRRVKRSFKQLYADGIYRDIAQRPIRPSEEECRANSRARPAKLRWAVKA